MMFNSGIRKPKKISVPVISVGNLTTGGTGKTPVVAWLVHELQTMNVRPGIISRGYRAIDETGNDEKRVLAKLCPGVPHEQHPSRATAAESLLKTVPSPQVIVMDDGFQHRQLHRDLNVLLIDATNPFGFGHLLPRGLLREPLASLRRADVVIITRSDMVLAPDLARIRDIIRNTAPQLSDRVVEMTFQPTDFIDSKGERFAVERIADRSVVLVSGIGNPSAFEETCRKVGLTIRDRIWFPDHHHFTESDVKSIREKAGTAPVVVTLKDLVKLPATLPALALNISATIAHETEGQRLRQLLHDAVLQSGDRQN